ncbi:MAG: gliding motility-associated C-terminal domain-containing protein [Cyclobacteriaceae bacterium]|nr:MAG: gliding motility-associated C-terminal domain-containing protein [Cyclobacteriaceae bacterium]
MKHKFLVMCLIISAPLTAQDVTIKAGTTITITAGTIFTIGNALTNNGTLVNNGSILIGGQWVNNGTYTPGTGAITFNSTAPVQVINHNAQAFNTLTISGGGVKQFLADITINDELILTDGILESSNNAKINFSGTSGFSGGSDAAHIKGTVQRSGQGDLVFPIGNGTTYLPVELINAGTGTNASFTLHEISSEVLTSDNSLTAVSDQRYWELSLQGGSLSQSKIKLPANGDTFSNLDGVVVAGSAAALGPYASFGNSDFTGTPASGSVLSEDAPLVAFYALAVANTDNTINVYNAVSVFEDGKNDYFQIFNIEQYSNSMVTIFNRWGDRVFQMKGYNNDVRDKRFNGLSDAGNVLPAGTYFYSINLGDGSETTTGYLHLK